MKKLISMLTVLALVAGLVAAADVEDEYPNGQIAFRLLDDYLAKEAAEQRSGGIFMVTAGGLMIGAGTAAAVWGFTADPGDFPNRETMLGVRIGSLAGASVGSVLTGIGAGLIARPDDFYQRKYADIYAERDPVVQEALAYGIIKDRAEEARRERISSGIFNVATPLIGIAINVGVSAAQDDWGEFQENTLNSLLWTSGSVISGFIQLFVTKSEEERLLDSYVSVRSAYDSAATK